jgi:arsenical pump membrane protein
MTVAYVPIIQTAAQTNLLPAVLATTIGSNLGANITPIGALAGIMWMSILRDKEVKLSFKEFVTYGLLVTPVTLLACLGILAAEFLFFL